MDRKLLVLALMGSLAGCVVVDDDDDDHDWDGGGSTMSCEYTAGSHSDDPLVSCRTGIGDDPDWFAADCEDTGGWVWDGACSSSGVVATCTYDLDGYAYVDNYYVSDDVLLDDAYDDCRDYGGDWWEAT